MAVGGGGLILAESEVAADARRDAAEEDDRDMLKEEEGLLNRRPRERSCLILIFEDSRSPFGFFFFYLQWNFRVCQGLGVRGSEEWKEMAALEEVKSEGLTG